MLVLKSESFKSLNRSIDPKFKFQNPKFISASTLRVISYAFIGWLFVLCTLPLSIANAAQVTLAWDASSGDVAGYIVYYGRVSRNYEYLVDVHNDTSCTISGLEEGETYYYAVTAYNGHSTESAYSEEVSHTIPTGDTDSSNTDGDTDSSSTDGDTDSSNTDGDTDSSSTDGDTDSSSTDGDTDSSNTDGNTEEIIFYNMDNTAQGFSTVGRWRYSTRTSGFYGTNYQYAQRGNGSMTATWSYNISTAGQYEIYAQWATSSYFRSRYNAIDAPYSIYNNGQLLDTVRVDQKTNGGQLNLLGTYDLNSGILDIVLTNDASGYVIADFTEIERLDAGSDPPPVDSDPVDSNPPPVDSDPVDSNPPPIDSDGDGISDDDEIDIFGTDPNEPDTDNDGINDGEELSYWGENWNLDYDRDGMINLLDNDSDGDRLSDGTEISRGGRYDPADRYNRWITWWLKKW